MKIRNNYVKISVKKRVDIMSYYFNKNSDFNYYVNDIIYVDKSNLIKSTNFSLGKPSIKFMCVTRPRRFGKTMAISMLNAYYSKGANSKDLFDSLDISKDSSYEEHLNKHNVIWIDMAYVYTSIQDKNDFLKELETYVLDDLNGAFPNVLEEKDNTIGKAIIKINSVLNERFILLIDEWDVILREQEDKTILCDKYIEFLRNLFKSSSVARCIDLVYMTGILPIRRYSTESALNMFDEYNMLNSHGLESYIGFTEGEVKDLCTKYNRDFSLIKEWYDGYRLNGVEIYNPKSVVKAVTSGEMLDYWVQTSAREAVVNYMNYDNGELKDIIARLIANEHVDVKVSKFDNDLTKVNSCDAALTVLIHLGYLAYDSESRKCYIPNHEIREEFINGIDDLNWKEIYNPIVYSQKLYDETMKLNADFVSQIIERNHKELASAFNKNKEDVLGVITLISYNYARKYYHVKKEDLSILGRCDLIFIPNDNVHAPFIIELKADDTVDNAIKQIKEKEYVNSLGDYKGKVLLIGIVYNSKTLKHECKIEVYQK